MTTVKAVEGVEDRGAWQARQGVRWGQRPLGRVIKDPSVHYWGLFFGVNLWVVCLFSSRLC